jgi:hypothetical protein
MRTEQVSCCSPRCDGHHEMSDLDARGEQVHSGGESVGSLCPAPAIRSLAKWSEVIMTTATDELRDDDLDGVSGGLVVIAILAILIAPLLPPPPTPLPKPS